MDGFNAAGLRTFGPTKAAAELEWSKFAKEILVKYNVPTAWNLFRFREAKAYIEEKALNRRRADGLALGKVSSLQKRLSKR